jgi:hypothetical protein
MDKADGFFKPVARTAEQPEPHVDPRTRANVTDGRAPQLAAVEKDDRFRRGFGNLYLAGLSAEDRRRSAIPLDLQLALTLEGGERHGRWPPGPVG